MKKVFLLLSLSLVTIKGNLAMQKEDILLQSPINNGIYEHYKGKRYKVLMIVWNSELDELEQWVVYQGLYDDPKLGNNPIFTRSLAKFSETIMIDDKEQPRFRFIE